MIRLQGWAVIGAIWLAAGLGAGCPAPAAEELPRKAALGVVLAPVPDETRAAQKLKPGEGVLIRDTLPGSTAQAAGLQAGDVLVKLGTADVDSPQAAVRVLAGLAAGK